MNTQTDALDQLAANYLAAVDRALEGVPENHRRELLDDLSGHIAAERAALDEPSEAALRAILDRLGDPAALAAEARLIDGGPDRPPTGYPAASYPAAGYPAAGHTATAQSSRRRLGWLGWTLIGLGLMLVIVFLLAFAFTSGSSGPVQTPSSTAPPLPSPPR